MARIKEIATGRVIINSFIRGAVITACVAGIAACKSKPKAEDQPPPTSDAGNQTPKIDETPMSFDLQGSDSGKIDGLQTINFDYDKSSLTGDAKRKAQGNAQWIKGHKGVNVQIEGHCDARGSIEYNLALGERRAQSVKSYLVSLGVDASQVSVISYGKEKPISHGESEADYAKNRRANFVPLNR
ncbi:MAG: peptidoglycan-associated lipoprotein Pal [Bdellovibrio sp.]|nr:MAG: peptidoglycan-associated lipoprotein Pal [Bdellovibrio sp.]